MGTSRKDMESGTVQDTLLPVGGEFCVRFDSGKLVDINEAESADKEAVDFAVSGSSATRAGVFRQSINPTAGLAKGQLQVVGSKVVMLKNMTPFQCVLGTMTQIGMD